MNRIPTHFQDIGDAKIAYCEHGSGPALILLHGNSESKAIFSAYQNTHFRDYHTYALDSRGHGETLSEDEKYSIHQYSQDVMAFCRVKGIREASVIGYSDGGNIALFLAKNGAGLFKKIVAISPNYLVSGTVDWALRLFQGLAGCMRLLGKLGLHTRKALLRFDLMLTDIGLTGDDLRSIQNDLRILYAEKDMIKESHILDMGRLIPGAAVHKVLRCNHLSILEKPETISDIRAYLGK